MQSRWPLLTLLALAAAICNDSYALEPVASRTAPARTERIALWKLDSKHQYSLLYSLNSLADLAPDAALKVRLVQGTTILFEKNLHAGDPDVYTQFRVPRTGDAVLYIENAGVRGTYSLQVNRWPLTPLVRSVPNHRWQDATAIPLNATVFASADDAEYIPLPGTARRAAVEDASRTDWYRFDFAGAPKLVFFEIDLTERDQIPASVEIFHLENGKPTEFYDGEDPVTLPHEVQALPGNKFTVRTLTRPGPYYVAVRASHPEYKLRTRTYDPPPYSDPREAVRTAVDYIISAGDSWHANTPRRGGILDRVASPHQETSLCVACHATHFPLRAQLYATRNGYSVNARQQLQFLTERFYNNPRPFYGFEQEGAVWARMISAPANVLGRMSHLMSIYEDQVTGERRSSFHEGIAKYLHLYYEGRDKLPPDETNGNTPLVSAHEVAWYAWSATTDPRLPELIAKGEVKNMVDLCYQTLALAEIDRSRYRDLIQKNAERILSLQRPDGQWSMLFPANQPEVEFQTGHALWALDAAGIPAEHPQVAKAIQYLLRRQQPFGGWMDPLQSFENFRTPFRETQMAVLALSAYFPEVGRKRGWNSPPAKSLSTEPVRLLQQLDEIWDPPSSEVVGQIYAATRSNDALIRQAAVEALGRLGRSPEVRLLGDPSKLVQRTSAWAARQAHVRHENLAATGLVRALRSLNDRTRWGATRVFAQHFSALTRHSELAPALERLLDDPAVAVRMGAVKALWQFWFWSADPQTRSGIEDSVLDALGRPQHPWVERNLHHAVYNLADENIRYLYNNWVPLLAKAEDRDKAIRGRLAVESRLADKFCHVLDSGSTTQKKALLTALTELPLRRGDVYELDANLDSPALPVYNRIGNDIEQIAFFGVAAERFARSLLPLLDSADPELRKAAARAALLVRDTRFGDVNRVAGATGRDTTLVLARLEKMSEAAEVVRVLKPAAATVAAANNAAGAPKRNIKLDEAYFRGYVQPILEKRGRDGQACVHCHATHTLFNGTYSTARNVVDPDHPDRSLLLLKPTSSSETEGIAGAKTISHGGGVRWEKDSPEYATILEWIKGAKE